MNPLDLSVPKEIRDHTEKSFEMVKEFMKVDPESEAIILHHHEHLDGSGYPFGLRGKEISTGARICALADAFDIINTNTSARERKPSFLALKDLRKVIPKWFDERLFKEFLFMFLPPKN